MLRSELKSRTTCAVFYGIFALSGFTGLIYESIWSHYLKLFLGHAAYAQVLVLAIFMGGMSLGAWLSGRLVGRLANPILAYALVEAAIGFLGIAFDPLFRKVTAVFLEEFLPHLHAVHWVQACKWGTAAALILPQSILLGATFPLMSNGLLRRFPQAPGRTLGVLYFSNSIGAAAGVMMSGFVLISLFGLPGTILTAGLVNVVLALVAYGIAGPRGAAPERPAAPGASAMPAFLLFAALITGLSSFIYEVIWIRMLSMVLGSSTHAFEM
ncbi:MAG: fused MFS/spermidine synthase, partial [Gammaproteobacteria bacterium]|nr:fused MFS/spermidine synthase [Gammaproteobacteria bacterium]